MSRARRHSAKRFILHVAPVRVVLDIGTGALALLAIFAAEAGASKVYAIEANAHSYAKALQSVRESRFSDRIVVLEGLSTNVTLPERMDLLVHENLGEIVSFEGAILQGDGAKAHRCRYQLKHHWLAHPERLIQIVVATWDLHRRRPASEGPLQPRALDVDALQVGARQVGALPVDALQVGAL